MSNSQLLQFFMILDENPITMPTDMNFNCVLVEDFLNFWNIKISIKMNYLKCTLHTGIQSFLFYSHQTWKQMQL